MTARDRAVVVVVAALAIVAASWFLLLAPARKDASGLDADLAAARTRLTAAQALVATGETARARYRDDYTTLTRLGKAVPADDDVPSLVVQLQSAASRSHVDFRSIELSSAASSAAPPSTGQGAVGAATGASGATGAAGGPATVVPATQAAAAALPPGAVVGAAGFPTMPFDFAFAGTFFSVQGLLARLNRFAEVRGSDITVRGRLLTVDGFSLTPVTPGGRRMAVSLHATSYLLPPGQSDTAAAGSATVAAALPAGVSTR